MLVEMVDEFYKDYPEVEKEKIKETTQYTWKQLYNNGKDVPEGNNDCFIHNLYTLSSSDLAGFKLTEERFVNNLWVSVNQPNIKEKVMKYWNVYCMVLLICINRSEQYIGRPLTKWISPTRATSPKRST